MGIGSRARSGQERDHAGSGCRDPGTPRQSEDFQNHLILHFRVAFPRPWLWLARHSYDDADKLIDELQTAITDANQGGRPRNPIQDLIPADFRPVPSHEHCAALARADDLERQNSEVSTRIRELEARAKMAPIPRGVPAGGTVDEPSISLRPLRKQTGEASSITLSKVIVEAQPRCYLVSTSWPA
jgi:hypothetical protein